MEPRMTTRPDPRKTLPLTATLAEAVGRWPDMMRGAGGVLALFAVAILTALMFPLPAMLVVIVWIVAGLAALAAFGGVTRIGVATDLEGALALGLGPMGFQLGRVEARLAGAVALCSLFMAMILAMVALVALALFGGAGLNAEAVTARDWAAVGPVWKLVLLAGVAVIVVGTPMLMATRLSLFAQATIGRGRMTSLLATSLTNGAILPLFLGRMICAVPLLIWAGLMATGAVGGTTAALLGTVVLTFVHVPLTAGFLGVAYRRLETETESG